MSLGAAATSSWATLLPGEVVSCSVELAPGDTASGHPAYRPLAAAEAALVRGASPGRVRQFTAGRQCAAAALARLGCAAQPLLRGPRGEPQWPSGVVGSITHDGEQAAAAVCRVGRVRAVGIDVERARPVRAGVARRVCTPRELAAMVELAGTARLAGLAGETGLTGLIGTAPPPEVVLFSAKESVFKAWYPSVRRSLRFHDVEVEIECELATFAVRFLDPDLDREAAALGAWRGRFAVHGCQVRTAVVVEQHEEHEEQDEQEEETEETEAAAEGRSG